MNAGALTISRNVLDQVSIWYGFTTPQPQLVFLYEPPDRLFYGPGGWMSLLASCAHAAPEAAHAAREAGEGGA